LKAVLADDISAVSSLVSAGAPITYADRNGRCPILIAAACGFTEVFQTLAILQVIIHSDLRWYGCYSAPEQIQNKTTWIEEQLCISQLHVGIQMLFVN